jgi:hypothetical protein
MYNRQVFHALDKFREAIILARDKYVLGEAMAHSGIGEIYDSVLKMTVLAKENFMKCIQLVQSLQFGNYHGHDWVCSSISFHPLIQEIFSA